MQVQSSDGRHYRDNDEDASDEGSKFRRLPEPQGVHS